MVRAFIAVKVDCTPLLRRVLGQLNRLGRALKSVSPDALHVTLKFFGDHANPKRGPKLFQSR